MNLSKTALAGTWKYLLALIAFISFATTASAQQWEFEEDFSTDTNKGASTTANWNTGTGVLELGTLQPLTSADVSRVPLGPGGEDLRDSRGIALGDFDGDGDLDIVIGNEGASGIENIIYRNVNGTFLEAPFTVGTDQNETLDIAVGDIDNDGDTDIVAGNYEGPGIYYLNDASSGIDSNKFATQVEFTSGTSQRTWAIALADFDGDGDLDYIEANSGSSSQDGQVNGYYKNRLIEDGGLSFDPVAALSTNGERARSRAVAVGDVDNDGDLDVVFGDQPTPSGHVGNNTCHAWTGNDFGGPQTIAAASTNMTFAVKLADVNGDGYLDLIEGSQGAPTYVYLNGGSGAACDFSATPALVGDSIAEHTTVALEVGDIDRDGDIDIVEGNNGDWDHDANAGTDRIPQPVRLFLNNGDGTFASGIDHDPPKQKIYGMDIGDLDGDNQLDLVSASSDEEQPPNDPIPVTGGNAVYFNLGTPGGSAVNQLSSFAISTQNVGNIGRNMESAAVRSDLIQPVLHASLKYHVSNDNGSSWTEVNPLRAVAFPNNGQQLMWRVQMDSLTPVAAQHPQIDFLRVADNRPPRFTVSNNDVNNPVVIQGNVGEDLNVNMNTWFNDLEDHQMTFTGNGIPATLSLGNRSGELSGTPDAGDAAASPIAFTVVAFDGLESRTGFFELQVGSGTNAPVAANDGPLNVAEGGTLNGTSVLANDTDPNGDPLTAILESGPANASSFTLNSDGTFTYVHDGSGAAADSFTYRASDGTLQSNVATVTIAIAVVDDPPVITLNGSATMNLTVGDTYTEPGATATDDEDGDISASIVIGGDTVDTATAGTYVVTYNVTDSGGNAAAEVTRTVTVSTAPPPPPPPPPPPSGGGGGLTGLWEMIALFAGGILSLARRRREPLA